MFTIRIDHTPLQRTVFSVRKYHVIKRGDGRTLLWLGKSKVEILLDPSAHVYVMNERGVTVDIIKPEGDQNGRSSSTPRKETVSRENERRQAVS